MSRERSRWWCSPSPDPAGGSRSPSRGGVEPVWSRDGRRIFYRDNQQFIEATVRTSPKFEVVSRQTLFEDHFLGFTLPHANYDVTADGTHFVFLKTAEETELQVVYNWHHEMRERLAGKGGAP